MNILIAPDSFKDSLKATEVANALKKGIEKIYPKTNFELAPMADGGEGTVDAIVGATHGTIEKTTVHDPLMRKVEAHWGITGDGTTAVIEMAAASGIELLTKEERNPWITTTYGTGELIKAALDKGVKRILVGIGGSATNDCGAGMAMALGAKFTDADNVNVDYGGGSVGKILNIDLSGLDSRLANTEILVACDVTNPLTGEKGASNVYGPQKGADADMVKKLDANLSCFAKIIQHQLQKDIATTPGAGAAGGLGAGLMAFLDAQLVRGFDMIANTVGIEQKIAEADLIITGEGKIDEQTQYGKTIFGISQIALRNKKPVIAVGGTIASGAENMYCKGVSAILPIADKPMSLHDALTNAPTLLENTGERIARIIQLGKAI
ncbi:MAG: glycerate kinase [Bacteroidales bacterium]|nr:glycerate kinase [Bacteroidales bacterium]